MEKLCVERIDTELRQADDEYDRLAQPSRFYRVAYIGKYEYLANSVQFADAEREYGQEREQEEHEYGHAREPQHNGEVFVVLDDCVVEIQDVEIGEPRDQEYGVEHVDGRPLFSLFARFLISGQLVADVWNRDGGQGIDS